MKRRTLLLVIAGAIPIFACADPRQNAQPSTASVTSPSPMPSLPATAGPSPSSSISPSSAQTTSPSAEPTETPMAYPSPSAFPTPTPQPTVPMLEADAPPQIVDVSINETTFHSGDVVSGEVITSSNVASVEIRIAKVGMSIPKVAPGHFALTYTVPRIPFYMRKRYTMNIIARNTRGDETSTSMPIAVR